MELIKNLKQKLHLWHERLKNDVGVRELSQRIDEMALKMREDQ